MAISLDCPSKTTLEIQAEKVVASGPTEAAAIADYKAKLQAEVALLTKLVENSFECESYGPSFESGGVWQGLTSCDGTIKITNDLQDVLKAAPKPVQQGNKWTIELAPVITYTITCGQNPPKSSKQMRKALVACEGMITVPCELKAVGTGATKAAATDDAEQKFLEQRFSVLAYLNKMFHCKNACQRNNLDRTACCERFSHTDFDKNKMKPGAPKAVAGGFEAECDYTIKFTIICQKRGATTYSGFAPQHPEPEDQQ